MPAIVILCVVVHVALVVHAIHRHRRDGWLLLMLMLPGAGALLYIAMMAWEAAVDALTKPAAEARRPRSAEDELHQRRAALALGDNLLNRLALALTCLKHGRYAESAEHFETLDEGECHDDPLVLLGLARSRFALEDFRAAKQCLDRLIAANPDFRSETGHLLYARSLEALGEVHDALHEYQALTAYSRAPEAHCRHALLLTNMGRPGEAQDLYRAMLCGMRRAPRDYARVHHRWIELAEREMAALTA